MNLNVTFYNAYVLLWRPHGAVEVSRESGALGVTTLSVHCLPVRTVTTEELTSHYEKR